jgi:hypothetical protein
MKGIPGNLPKNLGSERPEKTEIAETEKTMKGGSRKLLKNQGTRRGIARKPTRPKKPSGREASKRREDRKNHQTIERK